MCSYKAHLTGKHDWFYRRGVHDVKVHEVKRLFVHVKVQRTGADAVQCRRSARCWHAGNCHGVSHREC